jgi:hypothetical protein
MECRVGQILPGGRRVTAQARVLFARGVVRASSFIPIVLIIAEESPSSDIPTNAIYANGEPIPDPSGTGYLRYGDII